MAMELKGKGQALRLGIQQQLGGGPLTWPAAGSVDTHLS